MFCEGVKMRKAKKIQALSEKEIEALIRENLESQKYRMPDPVNVIYGPGSMFNSVSRIQQLIGTGIESIILRRIWQKDKESDI